MPDGRLFVISGPAGAGKGTLVSLVVERVSGVWLSVSATTRAPRGAERDGVDYRFLSADDFKRGIDAGEFLEWACVHGNYYGTPLAPIASHLEAGDTVLLEIDVQGGFQVREHFGDATLVFIAPPSPEELRRRLVGRGTDAPDVIECRLANAKGEMEASSEYDIIIVNDDVEDAARELIGVVESRTAF